ncbi:hypothetical protein [Streptomyces sioyaensis]
MEILRVFCGVQVARYLTLRELGTHLFRSPRSPDPPPWVSE